MRPGEICVVTAWLVIALSAQSVAQADVPEQFRVRGAHAKPNPYLADPDLASPRAVQVEATAEERARGFIVFSKPPGAVVAADYVPAGSERCAAIEVRDCPGQYGNATFTVFALAGASFRTAATDLAAPGGARIGAENLDLRAVRYAKVRGQGKAESIPLLIEAFDEKAIPEGRLQQFWITYYVPPATAPGAYQGQVDISADGTRKLSLPLRIRVNSFRLAEPDVSFYMYYGGEADPQTLQKRLVDQRCHGMNAGMVDPPVTQEGDLKLDAVRRVLDVYKQAGFARPEVRVDFWNRVTSEWLNTPDKSIGMWGPWFRYYPFTDRLDERYVRSVQTIEEETRRRGLGLILAVADEAGSHAWTIKATQHYSELIKTQVSGVIRELTVGGGWAGGQPEEKLWKGLINVWTTNRWLPDRLAAVRGDDPHARIELYNMAGAGSAAGGLMSARNVFGFFNWKARADGVTQWVYWHPGTPEHNYAWPAENPLDGMVPTLRWEAVREGTKDRRYLATLEERLAGKQGTLADSARKFLADITAKIELRTEDYDPIGGGRVPALPPETYDEWRARIADLIESLATPGG